jgi:TIR domain
MKRALLIYRSDDTPGLVRLIDRILRRELDNFEFVLSDVGSDFFDALRDVHYCDVVLVAIGPSNVSYDNFAYREVMKIAGVRGTPIFVVLLGGGRIPAIDQIPDDLKVLQPDFVQAVRYESFYDDMGTLSQRLNAWGHSQIASRKTTVATETPRAYAAVNKPLSTSSMDYFITGRRRREAFRSLVLETAPSVRRETSASSSAITFSRLEKVLGSMLFLLGLSLLLSSSPGRSALSYILSLLGLKLGSAPIPGAIDNRSDEPIRDMVDCSVFGPPAAPPGETILIQVFLHSADQFNRAGFLANVMDESAALKGTRSLDLPINRGARVEVSFSVSALTVDEPVQNVVWHGQPVFCQFLVTFPRESNGQIFFPVVRVSIDGKLIGCIKFRILADRLATAPQSGPLGDDARRYSNAFISYATADRKEVLKRVQMLEIVKTQFFMDLLSLDPGDRWERELFRHIDHCDLFLLFWSQAAKDSQWVVQEAEHALRRQQDDKDGNPDIVPVILEQGVLPPPSLGALHFNDRIQYLTSLMP